MWGAGAVLPVFSILGCHYRIIVDDQTVTTMLNLLSSQRQKEAELRQKKSDRQQDRVDRQLEKTSVEVEKASRSIKNLRRHVGGQDNRWSRIVEALVAGSLSEILAAFLTGLPTLFPDASTTRSMGRLPTA